MINGEIAPMQIKQELKKKSKKNLMMLITSLVMLIYGMSHGPFDSFSLYMVIFVCFAFPWALYRVINTPAAEVVGEILTIYNSDGTEKIERQKLQ